MKADDIAREIVRATSVPCDDPDFVRVAATIIERHLPSKDCEEVVARAIRDQIFMDMAQARDAARAVIDALANWRPAQ